MSDYKLVGKQEAFVSYYCGEANFNATVAAKLSGYSGDYATLRSIGSENLSKPNIAEAIRERMDKLAMPANEVILRLGQHARASLIDLLDDNGEFSIREVRAQGKGHLLKKLKAKKRIIPQNGKDRGGNPLPPIVEWDYEYEIHDPQTALVHIGRYHKLFTDKTEGRIEHANVELSPEQLAEIRKLKAEREESISDNN